MSLGKFGKGAKAKPMYGSTANGAVTYKTSGSSLIDYFFLAGAARNIDITPVFAAAYAEDPDIAVRISLWMRDIRGGAGERESFRSVLKYIRQIGNYNLLEKLIPLVPVYGRWDDLLVLDGVESVRQLILSALENNDGLCAKWMPRQGPISVWLRGDMSPRYWRKRLVGLSNTVEQLMCAKQWDKIEFGKLPSKASARYQKAFAKHCPHYEEYKKALANKGAKVNANAIFPHDILLAYMNGDKAVSQAQWDSLPNYMSKDASVLPVVDVSGSMETVNVLHIALALGIYCSDKLTGPFKDLVCTFSNTSEIYHIPGDLGAKLGVLQNMDWGQSTNIQAAFKNILDIGIKNHVPKEDMPKTLLILSDMEFNSCARNTNYQAFKEKYEEANYDLPNVVFWNLNGRPGNVPVRQNENGVALVSGFSPAIMRFILGSNDITPRSIMLSAVMNERYNWSE